VEFIVVILLGLSAPFPTVFSGEDYGEGENRMEMNWCIEDERGFYYPYTGLLKIDRNLDTPRHKWVYGGLEAKEEGTRVDIRSTIGFYGFYATSKVHVSDYYGLADPLFARLPAQRDPYWRIGHFRRVIPKGYEDSLVEGRNLIEDEHLAFYYEKLSLVIRGKLWDKERLIEIWKINTGAYSNLIQQYMTNQVLRIKLPDEILDNAIPPEFGPIDYSTYGVSINFGTVSYIKHIDMAITNESDYESVYYLDGNRIAQRIYNLWEDTEEEVVELTVSVPSAPRRRGFDRMDIFPNSSGQFRVQFFKFGE
jgi:arabinofuranosyltransferase